MGREGCAGDLNVIKCDISVLADRAGLESRELHAAGSISRPLDFALLSVVLKLGRDCGRFRVKGEPVIVARLVKANQEIPLGLEFL